MSPISVSSWELQFRSHKNGWVARGGNPSNFRILTPLPTSFRAKKSECKTSTLTPARISVNFFPPGQGGYAPSFPEKIGNPSGHPSPAGVFHRFSTGKRRKRREARRLPRFARVSVGVTASRPFSAARRRAHAPWRTAARGSTGRPCRRRRARPCGARLRQAPRSAMCRLASRRPPCR